MPSGHGFPSRNFGRLSWLNTSKLGEPKPAIDATCAPVAATCFACSFVTQLMFTEWTSFLATILHLIERGGR
jgi:hypothetical protein